MKKKRLTAFGKEVKERLLDLNMTQKQLAEKIGTSDVYLSMILHGERSGDKYRKEIEKVLNMKSNDT